MFSSVLLGVSDEYAAADVLNIKRREALPVTVIVTIMMAVAVAIAVQSERIVTEVHAFESRIVDFHFAGVEIGDVQKFVAVDLA